MSTPKDDRSFIQLLKDASAAASLGKQQLVPVRAELELLDVAWHIRSFTVREGLGIPFEVVLQVHTKDLGTRANDVLDQGANFAFGRIELREFTGIVERVVDLGIDDDVRKLQLWIVPPIAILKYSVESRVFVHRNVPEIISEYVNFTNDLREQYIVRDVCVQYQESHLDFVHRLMQEEGITYRFENLKLVLCDVIDSYTIKHQSLELIKGEPETEVLTKLQHEFSRRPSGFQVSAFNWRVPDSLDISEPEAVHRHDDRRQVIDTADNMPFEGVQSDRRAQLLKERSRYDNTQWAGESNASTIQPGSMFEVSAPEDEVRDGLQLTLTEVWHDARFPDVEHGVGEDVVYENWFRGTLVQFRPAYGIARPTISGPQTAIVVGPENEEIHTDEHGRIKVQFHWQKDQLGLDEGWWVRVASGWAGQGFGMISIPRVGMEVVVEFLNGNPDEPLVTGCVYNSKNLSTYELPKDKTKSTWRSESSPGGGGFNELRFEDAAGNEEVFLHAQRTMTEVVKGSRSLNVGGGRSASVGGSDSRTVGGDQTLTVKKNRTVTVQGEETVKVDGCRGVELGSDDSLMTTGKTSVVLQGGLETTVTSGEKRTVSEGSELSVTGEHKVVVTGKSSLAVTESHDATAMTRFALAQAKVGKVVLESGEVAAWGNASCSISSGPDGAPTAMVSCSADGKVLIEAGSEISLKVGETIVTLSADGTLSLAGPNKVTIIGGNASSMDLTGSGVEISGGEIKSVANGTHEIQGAMVKIN